MAKAKDILKVEPEPAKAEAAEAPPAAKEIGDHSAFLAERLDRSMKRFAAIKAKEKEMAEAMAEKLAKAKAAAPNDHVAPRIGARTCSRCTNPHRESPARESWRRSPRNIPRLP